MIELRLLGSLDLVRDGSPLHSVLTQPKRVALLAYLAAARPRGFQRKDRLLALFWPESSDDSARHALRQALYFLRRSMGEDAIISRGDDELAFNADVVDCDVLEFEACIEEGRPERALELYRGDFLDAFHLDDLAGFERWLDEARAYLRARAAQAAWSLSESAEAAEDRAAASDWARKAAAMLPDDEAALRRLVSTLDRLGDRLSAIRAYEAFAWRLEQEEFEPAAETIELIAQVRGRADARAHVVPSPMAPASAEAAVPIESPTPAQSPREPVQEFPVGAGDASVSKPSRRAFAPLTRRRAVGVAAVVLVALSAFAVPMAMRDPVPSPSPSLRLAVLYFADNSPGKQLEYLANGITAELIHELNQVSALQVISAEGVRQFRDGSESLESVAAVLGVDRIVEGSITMSGGRVRVLVQLTDPASGMPLESRKLERDTSELFTLMDELAEEVQDFVRPALGSELRARQGQRQTRNVRAWQNVQRASSILSDASTLMRTDFDAGFRTLAAADSFLVSAAQSDPAWDEPLLLRSVAAERMARIAVLDNDYGRADAWLDSALARVETVLARSPRSGDARVQRAQVNWLRWNTVTPTDSAMGVALLQAAERDLVFAVRTDSTNANAWVKLSAVYEKLQRLSEARLAAEKGYRADAFLREAPEVLARLFTLSFELHEDEEALAWCAEGERRFPKLGPFVACRLTALAWIPTERPDDAKLAAAWEALDRMRDFRGIDGNLVLRPRMELMMAAALARAGLPDSARAVIARARSAAPSDQAESIFQEAVARVALGENARAISLIRQYLAMIPSNTASIARGRIFSSLRDESFQPDG